MRFGDLALGEAHGAILAHSQRTTTGVIRKGTRLGARHIEALRAAGLQTVTAAVLDADDLHEDDAARALADALTGPNVTAEPPATGRANLFAGVSGLVTVDVSAVDRLNAIDPAITLATLKPFERVAEGRMIGTVKIIPFAARRKAVADGVAAAGGALGVAPWRVSRVTAISTLLPALKPSIVDKTLKIFAQRLEATSARTVEDQRIPHDADALGEAIARASGDVVVVFGASAVVDEDDVIPAAIRSAGGRVERLGMPVDPGNLLVLGEAGGRVVIGAPGCARSPKPNGFDFVLDRVLAGLPVGHRDVERMGVGGLLEETTARPQPRRGAVPNAAPRHPAAIVLAAGRSTRMGETNKLLENVGGKPVVRHAVEAALGAGVSVVVVTGHQAQAVTAALDGLDVRVAHNVDYGAGLSTSLRTGLAAIPADADVALILLGDMPLVSAQDCRRVLGGLAREGALIAMATCGGVRGNPVAWSSRLFPELATTQGDAGGRALLTRHQDGLVEVEIGAAAATDADTPDALQSVRQLIDSATVSNDA